METNRSLCFYCNHPIGRSPTGDWCSNCGVQDPCHCWSNEHEKCKNDMIKFRTKSGMSLNTECCCVEREIMYLKKINSDNKSTQ